MHLAVLRIGDRSRIRQDHTDLDLQALWVCATDGQVVVYLSRVSH